MAEFLEVLAVLDSGALQGLLYAGVALSLVFSFVALDFPDLTLEGTFPLGGAVAASAIVFWSLPAIAGTVLAVVVGALFGVVTAFLHLRFRISKLLSGIAVASMLYTGSLFVMNDRANLSLLDATTIFSWTRELDSSFNREVVGELGFYFHPVAIGFALVLAIGTKVVVDRFLSTEAGIAIRAVGFNTRAVRALGHGTDRLHYAGLAAANGLVAFSGALVAQSQGFSDVTLGTGVLVLALAALVTGLEGLTRLGLDARSIKGITRAAILGMIFYHSIVAVVMRVGLHPSLLRFVTGFLLVVILAARRRRGGLVFRW